MISECENEQIKKIDVFEKKACTFSAFLCIIQLSYSNSAHIINLRIQKAIAIEKLLLFFYFTVFI